MKKIIIVILLSFISFAALPLSNQAESLPFMDYYDSYYKGMPFRAWPIEKQWEFAKYLPAFIDANTEPGMDLYIPDSIKEVMEHKYGLPGEEDIAQDEAREKTIDYLKGISAQSAEEFEEFTWTYSFLVDDEHHPHWVITVYDGIYIAKNRLYRVSIPARGGDIDLLYNHKTAELRPEEILDQFSYSALPQDRENWTYQDKAIYGDKILELMGKYPGFNADQSYMVYSLPTEDEVSYDDALAFAKELLQKEYGGQNGWNDKDYPLKYAEFVRTSHSKDDMKTPYWSLVMGDEVFYHVYLSADPEGPMLLKVYTPEDTNG